MENSIDGENLLNYFLKPIKGVTDMNMMFKKENYFESYIIESQIIQ